LLAILLALTTQLSAQVASGEDEPFQVLILTDFDQRSGAFVEVANSFARNLLQQEDRPIVTRYVDLNARDQQSISAESAYRLVVQRVFSLAAPDLVVALGPPAADFWQRNRGEEFEQVPVLAVATEVGGLDPQFIAGQWAVISRFSFASQIEDIVQLLPDTRHVLLVFGASPHERKLASVALQQIQHALPDIELETSNDLALDALLDRASKLEKDSVVSFGSFDVDTLGELVLDEGALEQVRKASKVPVVGPFDSQLGHGIVGGRLIQLQLAGQILAEQAQ
jgi:hypothetical protein